MENILEFILNGLEKALEVERELGVRTVEIDRALLNEGQGLRSRSTKDDKQSIVQRRSSAISLRSIATSNLQPSSPPASHLQPSTCSQELVFVHDRPLSEKGVEMMSKILTAMGRTAENTPIVIVPPLPQAKIFVVLGQPALKKYFPGLRGEPGQWKKTPEGADMLITYSPEEILRFATVTPAVQKIKQDMWRSLKAVVQRLR